jgi:diacylglycerol kinase (ATP)
VSSVYGPLSLICNTRAGRGGVAKCLPEVEEHLRKRELEFDTHYTDGRGDATRIAREALDAGSRFLVAVGGDGTVHEVVNGMIEDDKPVNPEAVFGVVAAGTGSDFIKTFGIPAMPGHAVAHLDGAESFPIDIGKITYRQRDTKKDTKNETVRYFANIAQVGIGAEVVDRASRLPRWLGPTVYLVAFWLSVRKYKPGRVKVDLVDRTYEGRMNNMVVANGQFFGGGMKVAPKAAPTDGVLDIQIDHTSKREALSIIQKVHKGTHVPHPDIEEAKRAMVSIETNHPLLIEADGEVLGHTPAKFELLKELLNLKV